MILTSTQWSCWPHCRTGYTTVYSTISQLSTSVAWTKPRSREVWLWMACGTAYCFALLPVPPRSHRAARVQFHGGLHGLYADVLLSSQNLFQLNVCQTTPSLSQLSADQLKAHALLVTEIMSAFLDSKEEFKSTKQTPSREKYLSRTASDMLSASSGSDLVLIAHKLISIRGELLLLNLLRASGSQALITSQLKHSVWKKQACALVVKEIRSSPPEQVSSRRRNRRLLLPPPPLPNNVILTPHRFQLIHDKGNPLEVLSLLINNCIPQPSSACFHVDTLSSLVLHNMYTEKFALDNGLSCNMAYTSIMNHILRGVVILR